VLRIRIRDPRSGIRDPNPGWIFSGSWIQGVCFWWDFLQNPCSLIFFTNKTCSWNIPIFMYSRIRDPGSGAFSPPGSGSGIKSYGSGSGIKHPGSATLSYKTRRSYHCHPLHYTCEPSVAEPVDFWASPASNLSTILVLAPAPSIFTIFF
jgi:hypothetical protein